MSTSKKAFTFTAAVSSLSFGGVQLAPSEIFQLVTSADKSGIQTLAAIVAVQVIQQGKVLKNTTAADVRTLLSLPSGITTKSTITKDGFSGTILKRVSAYVSKADGASKNCYTRYLKSLMAKLDKDIKNVEVNGLEYEVVANQATDALAKKNIKFNNSAASFAPIKVEKKEPVQKEVAQDGGEIEGGEEILADEILAESDDTLALIMIKEAAQALGNKPSKADLQTFVTDMLTMVNNVVGEKTASDESINALVAKFAA